MVNGGAGAVHRSGIDHEIGAGAFVGVWHLARQDGLEFRLAQPPRQNAGALGL